MTKTTTPARIDSRTRKIAFLAGLLLAGVLVFSWRVPGGAGNLGADVGFTIGPIGELSVEPAGVILRAPGLEPVPGSEGRGSVMVRNQSGVTLDATMKAAPSSVDLDLLLRVTVDARGDSLFDGTLGQLRDGTERPLVLRSGETGEIDFRAWLPTTASDGYQGRIVDVEIELAAVRTKS